MGCCNCRHLLASPVQEGLAFCARQLKPVYWTTEDCANAEPLDSGEVSRVLAERGFVYCLSCRTTLVTESEVMDHVNRGHVISPRLLEEEVHEDVYAGD
ncbi:MAG: hypothetical protein QW394_06585 [Thermofilaceae archaeon]